MLVPAPLLMSSWIRCSHRPNSTLTKAPATTIWGFPATARTPSSLTGQPESVLLPWLLHSNFPVETPKRLSNFLELQSCNVAQEGATSILPMQHASSGFGGPMVDMTHTQIAAPSCNLFRNRDAHFTNIYFSDISNNSPHLFNWNFTARVLALLKTNTGEGYSVSNIFQNVLMLGAVTAHSQASMTISTRSNNFGDDNTFARGDFLNALKMKRSINSFYKTGMSYALQVQNPGLDDQSVHGTDEKGNENRSLINSLIPPSFYRLKISGGRKTDLVLTDALKGNAQFQETWQNLKDLIRNKKGGNYNKISDCAYGELTKEVSN